MYRIGTAGQSFWLGMANVDIRSLPKGASRTPTDVKGEVVPHVRRGSFRDTPVVTSYGPTGMLAGDLFTAVRMPEEKRREIQETNDRLKTLITDLDASRKAASGFTTAMAERQRETAAISIAQIREAIHRDRLIGLIDPKSAVHVARTYAILTRMNAENFAAANDALTADEDANIANLRPKEEGQATRDLRVEAAEVTVRTGEKDLFAEAEAAVNEAVGALDRPDLSERDGEEAQPRGRAEPKPDPSARPPVPGSEAAGARPPATNPAGRGKPEGGSDEPLYEIKALAVRIRDETKAEDVYDDRGIAPAVRGILDKRQKRREEDAATVKNLVLILRDINLMMRIAAKAAEKSGQDDKAFRDGLAQAQEAYAGAIGATAWAAMPLVESGININPDVPIGAPPRRADEPSSFDKWAASPKPAA